MTDLLVMFDRAGEYISRLQKKSFNTETQVIDKIDQWIRTKFIKEIEVESERHLHFIYNVNLNTGSNASIQYLIPENCEEYLLGENHKVELLMVCKHNPLYRLAFENSYRKVMREVIEYTNPLFLINGNPKQLRYFVGGLSQQRG